MLDWAKKTELSNKSALECVQVSLKLFSDPNFQIRNYFSDLVGIMQSLQAYNNTDYKLEYKELSMVKGVRKPRQTTKENKISFGRLLPG